MIRKETRTLKISQAEAATKAAFADKESSYDPIKQEFSFKVNKITEEGFRLVHDTVRVITTVGAAKTNVTTTIYKAEEFETKKQMETRINDLGLDWDPDEIPNDDDAETP